MLGVRRREKKEISLKFVIVLRPAANNASLGHHPLRRWARGGFRAALFLVLCALQVPNGRRIPIAQIGLDLVQQRGKHLLFRETFLHIPATVNVSVAGHEDHGNFRAAGMDPFRQFHTVHALHAKVGDQEIELLAL